jgi:hypothetical protein
VTALDRYAGTVGAIEQERVSGWASGRDRPTEPKYGCWRRPHRPTFNAAAYQDLILARRAGGLDSLGAVPL